MATDRATLRVEARTDFGSRPSRRLRRSGLVPGHRLRRAAGGARLSGARARGAHGAHPRRRPDRSRVRRVRPTPVVVKEQQRDPVRGRLIHLDLLEVKLDEEIQAEVPIELLGTEEAPGVKEGGVLEHVTHQITIEALPTAIPESIPADVSGMSIGDTLQLSAADRPRGSRVRRRRPRRGDDRHPLAAARGGGARAGARGGGRAGRRGGRGPRGRGGPAEGEAPRARRRPRAASPAKGSSGRCRFFAGCVAVERRGARGRRRAPTASWSSAWATRARATRPPATTSASRWPPSSHGAGRCRGPSSAFAA